MLTEVYDDYDCGIIKTKYDCYLLDQLPKQGDYFDYGKDKGYVISYDEQPIEEKEYRMYTLYYENKKGDWYEQNIDIAGACSICIKK